MHKYVIIAKKLTTYFRSPKETLFFDCGMQKNGVARKDKARAERGDSADTFGVRGAGASTWQARFGMQLNERDLLFAVRREPIPKRTVFDVAHDIFSKGFTVEQVSEKPDPNWTREMSKVLDGLNARANLTRLLVYERLFGWAILALTYVDFGDGVGSPLEGPRGIRELLPLSSLQVTVNSGDEDTDPKSSRFGLPNYYTARRSASGAGAEQQRIHFSRVIHCATRLLDHPWKGVPALEVLYDDQTVLRNARWALGETLVRTAAGFADITLKGATMPEVKKFEEDQNLRQLNQRSYFVHADTATVGWVGPAGHALDPEPYVNPLMESASCGTRIPLSHLRGATAGTLAGSEVNDREYWGGIASLQLLIDPVIWDLVDRLMAAGQIREVEDYRVVWPSGFELSESAKADIELKKAQALSVRSGWCTVNELRIEEGRDPLKGPEGDVVLGLRNARQAVPGAVPGGQQQGKSSEAGMDEADSGGFWLLKRLGRRKKS